VAVGDEENKDWMEIGDEKQHYPGKSHVKENGGVPNWSDDTSQNKDYKYTIVMKNDLPLVSGNSTNSTETEDDGLTFDDEPEEEIPEKKE
jgi:hypothetical protein